MDILSEISENLMAGEDEQVAALTSSALQSGVSPKQILDDGLISGMDRVGVRFKRHEIFLPDVLLAAKAMYSGMDVLKPLLLQEGIASLGKVVIGSVRGDLHDIGKNLVGIMLGGAGFEVIDLGNDVPAERFIEAAREHEASVIGLSALLTTTMSGMSDVVKLLKEEGLDGQVRVLVGGAPVSEDFAGQIGADAYGYDAASAVDRAKELTSEN